MRLALFLGMFASAASTARAEPLIVVTYNILAGDRGLDGIVETLRRADADIIALQEVDKRTRRSGRSDQPAKLGKALGMNVFFAKHFDYQGGEFGVALLSKHPIIEAKRRKMKGSTLSVLDAVVKTPDGELRVIVCHFTVTIPFKDAKYTAATERVRLIEAKAAYALAESDKKRPVLIMGDMNDDTGSAPYEVFRQAALQDACAVKGLGLANTWSSAFPITRIDYIWATHHFEVAACDTLKTEASDHLPVRAELTLPPSPTPTVSPVVVEPR